MKIKTILCPVDLSQNSEKALRCAGKLAKLYDSKIVILHCLPQGRASNANARLAASEGLKQTLVRTLAGSDIATLQWEQLVVCGDRISDTIATQAAIMQADIIVMMARRRPHRAALLGSTSESVSRTAPCPVLVLHPDERDFVEQPEESIEVKRVLVPYDFSEHSELALKYALSFAQEFQSDLHLLHVLPAYTLEESEISWYPLGREGTYHRTMHRLQKIVPAETRLWCKIRIAVREGNPYHEILKYAEDHQIDLICSGSHGAGFGMRSLFGSNVDRVLRQAKCPVLVSRPLKPAHPVDFAGYRGTTMKSVGT